MPQARQRSSVGGKEVLQIHAVHEVGKAEFRSIQQIIRAERPSDPSYPRPPLKATMRCSLNSTTTYFDTAHAARAAAKGTLVNSATIGSTHSNGMATAFWNPYRRCWSLDPPPVSLISTYAVRAGTF